MKCLLCKSKSCCCEKDVVLPTKSSLSHSVTEFPDKILVMSKENPIKIIVKKCSDPKISNETIHKNLSFDSKKDQIAAPSSISIQTRVMQISSSFPPPSLEKHVPRPFPPFDDYTTEFKSKILDCVMCSKTGVRPPSEPLPFLQQVSKRNICDVLINI